MEMSHSGLVAAGYSEEQAEEILAAHKTALNGKYVPKSRFDDVNDRMKAAEEKADGLSGIGEKSSALERQVAELKTELRLAKLEASKALENAKVDFEVEKALSGKVHDVELTKSLLDFSKISVKDGTVDGLEAQLETLRASKSFLFTGTPAEKETANPKPEVGIFGRAPFSGMRDELAPPKPQGAEDYGRQLAAAKVAGKKSLAAASEAYFAR